MEYSFNLAQKAWIPVVTPGGATRTVSLCDALLDAPAYRSIGATLPHTNAAVLRLMLAILHRNFGPSCPQAWEALWKRGSFDAGALAAYFAEGRDFDLFSSTRPFYQQRHPLVEEKPAQILLQQIGGGDTFTLFDHLLDQTPFALTPPEAALALITAQSFGLAGLCHPQHKLVYTDAPCSRAVVFFVEGKNLFETLMFNLIQYNRSEPFPWHASEADRPAWEAEDPYTPDRTAPLGYLDYLTWPSRRISLLPEKQNGQTVVTRITTAPGLVLSAEIRNPMHHYTMVPGKKAGEEKLRVLRFREDRALWRDSHALFDLRNQSIEPPRSLSWISALVSDGILPHRHVQLAAYGMCTEPGKQKVFFYRGEAFEIDDRLLQDTTLIAYLGTALERAEGLRGELWVTLNRLASQVIAFNTDQEDGRKPDPKDVQKLIQHWDAEGLYWSRLEVPFFHFLSRLPADPEGALCDWDQELRKAIRFAYQRTADGLGEGQNALKAIAKTRGRLSYGIKKVLGPQPQEEKCKTT